MNNVHLTKLRLIYKDKMCQRFGHIQYFLLDGFTGVKFYTQQSEWKSGRTGSSAA